MLLKTSPTGTITARFGEKSNIHTEPHTGVDVACQIGEHVHSPLKGVVERIVDYGSSNLGKGVFIKTQSGYKMVFGHLSEIKVKIHQLVNSGDMIGLCGSTGNSTGSHLHFGIIHADGHFINPVGFEFLLDKVFDMAATILHWVTALPF